MRVIHLYATICNSNVTSCEWMIMVKKKVVMMKKKQVTKKKPYDRRAANGATNTFMVKVLSDNMKPTNVAID